VLDLVGWASLEGRTHADATLDFMARQPLSAKGQVAVALFMARCLRRLIVPGRKALAVDLDNTLWGGVVGEDGIAGLKLGHEFPGNVHLRIQRELVELRNRGVLLALLSKNNEADVRDAFNSLPDMLLKWDDFAVRKINWNHKHENLRDAARELGLGLDSFVFMDDSDYEREQMRQFLPEVLILNESSDPLHTLRSLWETDSFDSLAVTEEDRLRHRDYTVRAARDVEAHQDDLETFLQSLEMEATIEDVGPANIDRALAMIGKTNQFNLTTRRHSRVQLQAMLEAPGSIGLVLRLRDKFGDQGIVALLLAIPAGDNATLAIDSFLVSCRALGRGVEDALWAAMVKRANRQNVRKLEAEYLATAKNGIVASLYDRLGLQRIKQNSSSTWYRFEPVRHYPVPSWIKLEVKSDEQ
jgi:FkbH-like protein